MVHPGIVIVVAVLIATVFLALRQNTVFQIHIRDGKPVCTKGKSPPKFLAGLQSILRQAGVDSGSISGVRQGDRISLRFSRQIPPELHQPIRNLWHFR